MKTEISKIEYEIEHLANVFGWKEILPCPNDWTISFIHQDYPNYRINVYFTRMTVQVQSFSKELDPGMIKKNCTMSDLEDIFEKYGFI